jgi:hypothetical protein
VRRKSKDSKSRVYAGADLTPDLNFRVKINCRKSNDENVKTFLFLKFFGELKNKKITTPGMKVMTCS